MSRRFQNVGLPVVCLVDPITRLNTRATTYPTNPRWIHRCSKRPPSFTCLLAKDQSPVPESDTCNRRHPPHTKRYPHNPRSRNPPNIPHSISRSELPGAILPKQLFRHQHHSHSEPRSTRFRSLCSPTPGTRLHTTTHSLFHLFRLSSSPPSSRLPKGPTFSTCSWTGTNGGIFTASVT